MKVISVKGHRDVYTSSVYLVLGDWKRLGDPNTLIDVGTDPSILQVLEETDTGVGKKKVEQVILTHSHSDHCAILPLIRKTYDPVVFGFSSYLAGVDRVLKNGDVVRIGDRAAEIIHTPVHSEDSICIYCPDERVLFNGDVSVGVNQNDSFGPEALRSHIPVAAFNRVTIFSGHDRPLMNGDWETVRFEGFNGTTQYGKEKGTYR